MTIDFTKAVPIGIKSYWIGKYLENDPFQCLPYFIENGNESVLIDPGSLLEFDIVIEKIKEITPLKNIKYIILHHQDPDICASIVEIENSINREDLQIVTHSRMSLLIKHYMARSNYYEIDKNNFELHTNNGLSLKFVTTPYCHSPGAFVTYDPATKILYSSDIFGGVEESWNFYADEHYFEQAKAFHSEYMPSKDIFNYTLRKIEKFDIELIAPQHGSLIKREFVAPLIAKMKNLDCGLYIAQNYIVELNTIIQKLESKDQQLMQQAPLVQMGEMINMIAHQWRQPLGSISAASIKLEIAKNLGILEDKEFLSTLKLIQEIVNKMSQTIDDFMNLSNPSKEKKSYKLQDIFDETLRLIGTQLKARNISFEIINNENIELITYKKELQHILINLLTNARDAFNNKNITDKKIIITTYKKQTNCYIEIKDNAGGIAPTIIKRVFEPYFTTKPTGVGTGLGLYMSQKILNEVLNGKLFVKNTDNGAQFTIQLPQNSPIKT